MFNEVALKLKLSLCLIKHYGVKMYGRIKTSSDTKNISSLIQLREQIAVQQYEVKAPQVTRFSLKRLHPTEQL
jgi:hypothetical protein